MKYCGLSEAYLLEFNQQLNHLQAELKKQLPNLYADLVAVKASRADDEDEKGHHLAEWIARIEYLLEVRAHSRIGEQESAASDRPKHILVSHPGLANVGAKSADTSERIGALSLWL